MYSCSFLICFLSLQELTKARTTPRVTSLARYPTPCKSQAFSLNVPSYSRVERFETRTWPPVNTAAAATAAVSTRTSTKKVKFSTRSHTTAVTSVLAASEQVVSLDDRHQWQAKGGSLAAAGLLALSFVTNAGAAAADPGMPGSGLGCSTSTNPSYSMVSCERTGLDRDGRLLGCR